MAAFRLYPSIQFSLRVALQKIFRSPLELRSDCRETSGKRVLDDLQFSIFQRWKKNRNENSEFWVSDCFFIIFGGFWRN